MRRKNTATGSGRASIASARTLNACPPDPRWPQTPARISPHCKSVIVIVQHIPAGAFRCKTNPPVQYMDMLVLRKMDKIAYRIAEELEAAGHFTTPDHFVLDPNHARTVLAHNHGKTKMITYWCDVCSIRAYAPGPCVCCQKETTLDLRDPDDIQ